MFQLWLKEARSLAFGAALVGVLIMMGWGIDLVITFPDQRSLAGLVHRGSQFDLLLLMMAGMMVGSGLLVRDKDEGTLAFLDALPVSRERVFAVKVSLALNLIWLLPLNTLARQVCFQSLSRTSLDPGLHWDVLLTGLGLNCAMGFVFLAMSLALSFLRQFAWIALGLWGSLLVLLRVMEIPIAFHLFPFAVTRPVYSGQHWLVPWEPLTVQLFVGTVCLWIALRSFQSLGDRAIRLNETIVRHRRGGGIAATGIGLAVLFWSTSSSLTWHYNRKSQEEDSSGKPTRVQGKRHEFIHRARESGAASRVIANSEEVRSQVESFLDVSLPSRVVVDLRGGLERHAGRAYWKKIRMGLGDRQRDVAVFAHELTHVLLDQAAHGRLDDSFNSIRFFHEGLATYVERRFYPVPGGGDMDGAYRLGAVARERLSVRFEELVDDNRLSRRLDRDLVYPLGTVFVEVLVKRYGTNAPARVAAAFGRAEAPKGLKGMLLWRDTLQACGYNLADAMADFYARLDEAVLREREFLAGLPRLQGAVSTEGGQIVIRAVPAGPGKVEQMWCRIRQRDDSSPEFDRVFSPADRDRFLVPKSEVPGRSFWYQLGIKRSNVTQIIYEPWVEARF